MARKKIELQRCFISTIDSTGAYVDYNEYTMDPNGEIVGYVTQIFSYNYRNTKAKTAVYAMDSYLADIVPEDPEHFDAFVDVIADSMHETLREAYGMSAGSGLFVFAFVDDQPVIAFFKLNYQTRLTCEKDTDGTVIWKKDPRLLPGHTQKEYDYFFISPYERRVWMSDTHAVIGEESINYLAERILKITLHKSEKEVVDVIQNAMLDTIRECYDEEVPKKVFEYRQTIAAAAQEAGEINPEEIGTQIFADNEAAMERYEERAEDMQIPTQAVYISPPTRKALNKKQKIVTENGIEILVPVEFLEDKEIFDFQQDEHGSISIVIRDTKGVVK